MAFSELRQRGPARSGVFQLHNACEQSQDRWSTKPPRYIVNLSLPPAERYQHVAADFKTQTADLCLLFDQLAAEAVPKLSVNVVRKLAKLTLRRVYNDEENEELKSIAEVLGLEMWLLVALNVLLDSFMGCTSGAARIHGADGVEKMLHFRTLDWDMDALRKIIVQLDFVEQEGGHVFASSLTYAGFVGVLTGVRRGLSMSLNLRACHNDDTRVGRFRFYFHNLLVILGYRPSIASLLRQQLLAHPFQSRKPFVTPTLEYIEKEVPKQTTTAAYLIFCDGDRAVTMEKDHSTAIWKSSSDFIVTTNHDVVEEGSPNHTAKTSHDKSATCPTSGMEAIVEDSMERKALATKLWGKFCGKHSRTKSSGTRRRPRMPKETDVVQLVSTFPITNEMTHFSAVMDPVAGEISWVERYIEPLEYEDQ